MKLYISTTRLRLLAAASLTLWIMPVAPASAENTVCFFSQEEFRGPAHCAPAGTRTGRVPHRLPAPIKSLTLNDDAVVRVCEQVGFGGRCMLMTSDRASLRGLHVSRIESYEIMSHNAANTRFINHVGYQNSGRFVTGN